MEIRDGLWDYMSETTVSTMDDSQVESHSARVTFMEGTTEVEFTGVTAVATNGQTIVNPEGPIAVSRNATVFYDSNTLELDWMRKVEVLHDPLYLDTTFGFDGHAVTLDAENFEAPNGFCATRSKVLFNNCAFKTVPKVYSDELMAELPVWPPYAYSDDNIFEDTQYLGNCPNVEKVAPQGQLGENLKVLYLPQDFTYMQDGKRMLDAFPTGGAPEVIVSLMGPFSVGWEEMFPSWDMSKLKICVGLLDDITLVAKKGTTPSIPLLGLDFASATELEVMSVGFNLAMDEDYDKDIVVTTGSLGIVVPDSVKEAPGAWRMWQNSTGSGKETHVATPEGLRALELDAWADALEDYVGDRLTKDAMPLTPSGLVDARGYYMKHLNNFDQNPEWVKEFPPAQDRMAHHVSLASKIMIDGVQSQFTIEPLPPTVERADFYAAGTYQHSEVVTDITVPAIPSSATTINGAYMRTFYQAIGKEVKSGEVDFPQMVLTRVNHGSKGVLYECTKPEDVKLNECYDAIYRAYLEPWDEDGNPPGIALVPWPEYGYNYNSYDVVEETTVEYSDEYLPSITADPSRNENYRGLGLLHVIRDWMKNTVVKSRYVTAEITNSIVLEREPLPSVTVARDFQLETFYGSGVMPNRVNCLIPVSGTTPTGRSYQAAINVKPVRESTVMPDAAYNHELSNGAAQEPGFERVYNGSHALRYYTALLRPELQKYTFNSDELIIEPGLTGTDESFIGLLPPTTKFSSSVGQFATDHGIGGNLDLPLYLSGVFTFNPRWTLMYPMNAWRFPPFSVQRITRYYVKPGFSYSDEPASETGVLYQAPDNDNLRYEDEDFDGIALDAYTIYLHTQDGQKSFQEANGG